MFSPFQEVTSFLRWSLLTVNFSSINLLLESSEVQTLRFSSVDFKVLFCPGSLTLTGVTHREHFTGHPPGVFRGLHTAGSAVSPTPAEPRQRALLAPGCGSCVCRNEWLFSLLSFLKRTEVKKVSALTRDTRISALEESGTRGLFLLVFRQNKSMIN